VTDELTLADRRTALAALERICDELGLISTWLSGLDEDKAAIELEQGWQAVAAAPWLLERPVRTRLEGWPRAQDGQQGAVNRRQR
jgi:hypothetical protein